MKKWMLLLLFCHFLLLAISQDTITVQTLTFDSITTRRGTWQFPEGESLRKILMYYTLKCDPQTTWDQYDCGEWDYLTYNIVYRHTGVYDSALYFHPNFTLIEGSSPDSLLLSDAPTWYYQNHRHRAVTFPDTLLLQQAEIGSPYLVSGEAIQTDRHSGRSQYLWKAEEITGQGFTGGLITGLKLKFMIADSRADHFMIRMKNTDLQELTPDTLITGMDTVFYNEVEFGNGWQDFNFFHPFEWDGQSDIVVDFSFTNQDLYGETPVWIEHPGFNCGISSGSDGFAIDLDGTSDFLKIPDPTIPVAPRFRPSISAMCIDPPRPLQYPASFPINSAIMRVRSAPLAIVCPCPR